MARFEIDSDPEGDTLVALGEWSKEHASEMTSRSIKSLLLNDARGWIVGELGFLASLPFLERFRIIAPNVADITPIHALSNLRVLGINTYCGTRIDFSAFPRLEDCFIEWRPGASSLFSCTSLKRLYVNSYKGRDTEPFAMLTNLEKLTIANGPVGNLSGVSRLKRLRELGLYLLRRLDSLSGVERLTGLKRLDINTCRRIGRIAEIAALRDLEVLLLCNMGEIDSLKPLENLKRLQQFIFYESTNVLDGDLSVLKRLPKLKSLSFRNRRHYSNRREEFGKRPVKGV